MLQTLEKTIDLFENGCIRPCIECPCYGMKECEDQLRSELYYLKAYKRLMDSKKELEWIGIIDENNKPNEQDGKTEVVEKITLRDECENKLYLWGMILICFISYACFAMFNLPFALMVIPIIFSAYAFTLRKIDKKKAKLFSIIAFITMIILMIVSGMAYDAYIEKRMRDLALSFVIKYV